MTLSLLQQLQRAQRQQIRIARARPDQIYLPECPRLATPPGGKLAPELRLCRALVPVEHALADRPREDALPEAPALAEPQCLLHSGAPLPGKPCESAEARRQERLELLAQAACEHRRASFGADRHDDR